MSTSSLDSRHQFESGGQRPSGTRVAMMVWNTCENDSRVIKEATTLSAAGYDVTVICLTAPHLPDREVREGVTYQRVDRDYTRIRGRFDFVALTLVLALLLLAAGAAAQLGALTTVWTAVESVARSAGANLQTASPTTLVAIIAALLVLGLASVLAMHRKLGVVPKPRWVLAKVRIWLRRPVKFVRIKLRRWIKVRFPLRARILGNLYRLLTFGLTHDSMAPAVAALRPAVIHAHDLQTLPAGRRMAKELGSRLVYDSHELATHVSTRPPRLVRRRMRRAERESIPHADLVITVSEGIAKHLVDEYNVRLPVVIFNSPPITGARRLGDVRGDLGLGAEVPLALYVGVPTANRGLEQTVDTLALLPDFHLACVGPRRPDWEGNMLARADRAGSAERLHFLDPRPIEELIHYLSTADVGVLAIQNITLSYWYTMPNKLFETVLAGVPVVVANLPHLRDFVERHGVGHVADETDPSDIAKAMRRVYAEPQLRPRGERLERLREEYGWEAQARQLTRLYQDLGIPASQGAGSG